MNIFLKSGWNEISIPISIDMKIRDLSFQHWTFGDIIKTQTEFTDYYDGYGFFGVLEKISPPGEMIKIKVENSGNLVIDTSYNTNDNYQITLHIGWNWIPYLFENSLLITSLFSDTSFVHDDYIKSRGDDDNINGRDRIRGFSVYYDGYGFYGSLTTFEKNFAYMMKVSQGMTLTFNKNLTYNT